MLIFYKNSLAYPNLFHYLYIIIKAVKMNQELKKYQDLVSGLLQKLDEERQKNSRLESELTQYREGNSAASQIAQKDEIIAKQQKTIDSLNAKLLWLQRKVWGQSSEKRSFHNNDGQLVIDFGQLNVSAEEEAAYTKAQQELTAYHQQRKAAAEKRKTANKPSRNHIPDNIRRERVDIYPKGYNEQEWDLMPESFNEPKVVLCRKPAEYYAIEYVMHKAVRKDDIERTIKASPVPQMPIAKSYAGASVLANLMVGKYVDSLPFYRQIEIMKRQGMNIPPSTITDWFSEVADLLRPLYFRIRELVLETDYIQADETTVPIVDNEKHKTVKGYLWQVCSVMQKLLFFHYDKGSRSKDVAMGLFAHFSGALQTDGYAVYDYYEKKDGVLCLNCWAHARRYFDRALNNDTARAEYAIKQIGLLYEVERKAEEEQMNHEQRRELRMRLSVPILHTFEAWLHSEATKVLPKSPIGKAINYTLEHYDRLCRYVVDGRYKIDTNMVENGQRPVALSRKNYLFCKNHDAAEDAAVMYTMMGCCKIAGVNVEDWLTYFLEHVHEYDTDYSLDLADFLPYSLVAKGILKESETLSKIS